MSCSDEYLEHYMDGDIHIAVEIGMPSDPVLVGVGDTWDEAVADLGPTPIQSAGRDPGQLAIDWAEGAWGLVDPMFIRSRRTS